VQTTQLLSLHLFTPSDTFWLGCTVLPQYKTLQTTDDGRTTDRQTTHRAKGSTDSTVGQKSATWTNPFLTSSKQFLIFWFFSYDLELWPSSITYIVRVNQQAKLSRREVIYAKVYCPRTHTVKHTTRVLILSWVIHHLLSALESIET